MLLIDYNLLLALIVGRFCANRFLYVANSSVSRAGVGWCVMFLSRRLPFWCKTSFRPSWKAFRRGDIGKNFCKVVG